MNNYSRQYNAQNKDGRTRRDEKRAAQGSRAGFDLAVKEHLFRKQNGICPACMEDITHARSGEVDHIIPLSKGGRDDESNYILLHARCNREKHGKTLLEHWEWRVKIGRDAENIGRRYGLIA